MRDGRGRRTPLGADTCTPEAGRGWRASSAGSTTMVELSPVERSYAAAGCQ